MELFLTWLILSILAGYYAGTKGRSSIGFFFLSIFLSPLIGFIAALVLPKVDDEIAKQNNLKKCPYCKELVKQEATVCKHCGKEFGNLNKVDKKINYEYRNSTHYLTIEPFEQEDFEDAKTKLYEEYRNEFDIVAINDERTWKIKSDSLRGYVQIEARNGKMIIEAYNTDKPSIYSTPIPQSSQDIDKLIELSKMLEKGLITEKEFLSNKNKLSLD